MLLILGSILLWIRYFEDSLFYDPFIAFFKSDYQNNPIPEFNTVKLLYNLAFRYLLNTLVSLAVLWVLFEDKEIMQFSLVLYSFVFVVLLSVFSYFIFTESTQDYLPLFYVRRFLIQPLFLLLLIPAFYFQNTLKKD